jgi:hypothetical protein
MPGRNSLDTRRELCRASLVPCTLWELFARCQSYRSSTTDSVEDGQSLLEVGVSLFDSLPMQVNMLTRDTSHGRWRRYPVRF